jgi:hypothetical protein
VRAAHSAARREHMQNRARERFGLEMGKLARRTLARSSMICPSRFCDLALPKEPAAKIVSAARRRTLRVMVELLKRRKYCVAESRPAAKSIRLCFGSPQPAGLIDCQAAVLADQVVIVLDGQPTQPV